MRVHLAAGCALLLATACAHPSTTGRNEGPKDATATEPGRSEVRAREVTPKTPPGHPPLAASPSELLEPGARQKIARALESRGLVDSADAKGETLSTGLRKFQESQGLAATGFPDHETVQRLGIDPKEVDRSLENFSGTEPGKARADVSNPSDDAGKGGSGGPGSGDKGTGHATPPSDPPGSTSQKAPDSSDTGGR